jgi:release factor glutamine methyltransferase
VSGLDLGATIGSARRAVARTLRERNCDSPDLDARLLVGDALALDHAGLIAGADRALTPAEAARIIAATLRRLAGEPVARIRGSKEFWGLDLVVTPAVLVPRPETETIVEAALAAVEVRPAAGALRIADLGTGSGAILLALLYELPNARGVGTDRSRDALIVARDNARRHALDGRTGFVACDQGTALAGGFDLVVANPPYIPHDAIAGLAVEVRAFDPMLALDGGPDGLAAYRAIAADARRLLRPGGTLVLELGMGQDDAVARILADHGLTVAAPARPDLSGIPRALAATC